MVVVVVVIEWYCDLSTRYYLLGLIYYFLNVWLCVVFIMWRWSKYLAFGCWMTLRWHFSFITGGCVCECMNVGRWVNE